MALSAAISSCSHCSSACAWAPWRRAAGTPTMRPRRWRWSEGVGRPSPVRGDQILFPRRLPGIDGDLVEVERAGERDFLRVRAGERGLDLGGHPLSQLLGGLDSNLLQERGEEPAADAPGHSEGSVELGRSAVEAPVD